MEDLPTIVERLLTERGITLRRLGILCRERGWGSIQMVHDVVRRESPATRVAMETIAAVLGVTPDTFAEYRLLRARDALDPREVGLEAALRNLGELPSLGEGLSDQEREQLIEGFRKAVDREAERIRRRT